MAVASATVSGATQELSFSQAINQAIRQEMRRDPTIVVIGEDVAGAAGRAHLGLVDAWGGPTRSTRGLVTEFGADRVLDTPISEMGFVGAAVGGAVASATAPDTAYLVMAAGVLVSLAAGSLSPLRRRDAVPVGDD